MNHQEIADTAVEKIIDDICDRCGLDNEWDDIDDETKDEIRAKWVGIIKKLLDKYI